MKIREPYPRQRIRRRSRRRAAILVPQHPDHHQGRQRPVRWPAEHRRSPGTAWLGPAAAPAPPQRRSAAHPGRPARRVLRGPPVADRARLAGIHAPRHPARLHRLRRRARPDHHRGLTRWLRPVRRGRRRADPGPVPARPRPARPGSPHATGRRPRHPDPAPARTVTTPGKLPRIHPGVRRAVPPDLRTSATDRRDGLQRSEAVTGTAPRNPDLRAFRWRRQETRGGPDRRECVRNSAVAVGPDRR